MKPTNLLVIMSDEHNPKVMGLNGHPLVQTPNLDRLAQEGTTFTSAYTCPVCVPARAAFAVGKYVHQAGYWDNADAYEGAIPSWHHHLRDTGHRVDAIGKLHFRDDKGDDYGFNDVQIAMQIIEGKGDLMGLVRNDLPERALSWKIAKLSGPGETSYTAYGREIATRAQIWLREEAPKHTDSGRFWCVSGACAAGAAAALFFSGLPGAALAQYPERPIRIIVPAGVGGGSDIGTRLIAGELIKQLGQHVIVENRAGASGILGTEAIARAAADGYTLGQGNFNSMNTNRVLNAKLPYDPDRDLQAIVFAYMSRNILAVNRALPITSVKELIAYAKANPGKVLYASGGNGSSGHFSGALLGLMAGIEMTHVPYKASGPAITDLVSGQVHLMSDNVQSIGPHVKAGRLRGLAVTTANRTAAYPDLPTVAEAGVPGFEIAPWAGYIAPAGVPKAIIARLNAELNRALAVAAVRDRLVEMGLEPRGGTPDEVARFIRSEVAKWSDVARRADVRGE